MRHSYNLLNEATVLMNCVLSPPSSLLSPLPTLLSVLISSHTPFSCSLQGVDGEPFE